MNLVSDPQNSGASFSADGKYRYKLWRHWGFGAGPDATNGTVCFLMLNPSTADHEKNDPTVERCQRRAHAMGYGGLVVTNLFALRSTDPRALKKDADPVGPDNDQAILEAASSCQRVICAWGTHGVLHDRGIVVLKMLALEHKRKLLCLGLTSGGHPRHPLYVSYKVAPQPWF
jgi:hypothetical protein